MTYLGDILMKKIGEQVSKQSPLTDGVISFIPTKHNRIQTFATVKNNVSEECVIRFCLTMKRCLGNKKNFYLLYNSLTIPPIFNWYILFETSSYEFNGEIMHFLDFLYQERIITNPFIMSLERNISK